MPRVGEGDMVKCFFAAVIRASSFAAWALLTIVAYCDTGGTCDSIVPAATSPPLAASAKKPFNNSILPELSLTLTLPCAV